MQTRFLIWFWMDFSNIRLDYSPHCHVLLGLGSGCFSPTYFPPKVMSSTESPVWNQSLVVQSPQTAPVLTLRAAINLHEKSCSIHFRGHGPCPQFPIHSCSVSVLNCCQLAIACASAIYLHQHHWHRSSARGITSASSAS